LPKVPPVGASSASAGHARNYPKVWKINRAIVRTKALLVIWAKSPNNNNNNFKSGGKGMEKYFIVPLCAAKLRTTD
jgi:hypothetical protein